MGKSRSRHTRVRYSKKPSAVSNRPRNRWVAACLNCGKHGFRTRSDARAAAKDLWPGDPMSVYKCGELFHYGHNERKYEA